MYITYKSSVCRVLNFNKTFQRLAIDFPGLYQRVTQALVQRAHTTKLEKTPALSQAKTADNTSESVAGMESKEISKKATPNLFTYMNPAKITEQQRIKIEWLMFRMFICCALPWMLMNNQFFIEFVLALAPNFSIPDRSAFFPKHLAQEVAVWDVEQAGCQYSGPP